MCRNIYCSLLNASHHAVVMSLCSTLACHLSTVFTFHFSHFSEPATISLTSSPSSPVMAGVTVTLTCSLSLPSGVTDTPEFQWEGPHWAATPNSSTSELTLSEILPSQAGWYSCTASVRGSITTYIDIFVQGLLYDYNFC